MSHLNCNLIVAIQHTIYTHRNQRREEIERETRRERGSREGKKTHQLLLVRVDNKVQMDQFPQVW